MRKATACPQRQAGGRCGDRKRKLMNVERLSGANALPAGCLHGRRPFVACRQPARLQGLLRWQEWAQPQAHPGTPNSTGSTTAHEAAASCLPTVLARLLPRLTRASPQTPPTWACSSQEGRCRGFWGPPSPVAVASSRHTRHNLWGAWAREEARGHSRVVGPGVCPVEAHPLDASQVLLRQLQSNTERRKVGGAVDDHDRVPRNGARPAVRRCFYHRVGFRVGHTYRDAIHKSMLSFSAPPAAAPASAMTAAHRTGPHPRQWRQPRTSRQSCM